MADYVCKVGTPAGEILERSFSAEDEGALRADLERQGYYLFSMHRALAVSGLSLRRERIKNDVVLLFAQELAALLKAGLPLVQAIEIMMERQRDPLLKRSLAAVRDKIKSGTSLSDAFAAEGDRFPAIFSASLVAGERSGNLEGVLRRFVQYERLTQTVRKKAVSAAIYPAAVLTIMVVLMAVMTVVVIPAFQGFYEGLNAELPLVTKLLLGFSSSARKFGPWVLLVTIPFVLVGLAALRTDAGRIRRDRFLLTLPLIGPLLRMYSTSQLARTLATLLAGGLPLLSALEVAASAIGNRAVASAVRLAMPLVREGKSLMVALDSMRLLDPVALEMVKVGEQTGALTDMLSAISDFFDEELDTRVARLLALVEPAMLMLMAVVVAGMLLAFYMPMFQIFSTLA